MPSAHQGTRNGEGSSSLITSQAHNHHHLSFPPELQSPAVRVGGGGLSLGHRPSQRRAGQGLSYRIRVISSATGRAWGSGEAEVRGRRQMSQGRSCPLGQPVLRLPSQTSPPPSRSADNPDWHRGERGPEALLRHRGGVLGQSPHQKMEAAAG